MVFFCQVTGGGDRSLSIRRLLIVAGYLIMRLRHHFKYMKAEPEQPMNDSVLLAGKFDNNFEV